VISQGRAMRWGSVFAALVAAVTLGACGGGGPSHSSSKGTAGTPSSTATPTTQAQLSDAEIGALIGCDPAVCALTGRIEFVHPGWGPSALVTTQSRDRRVESNDLNRIVVLDRHRQLRWQYPLGAAASEALVPWPARARDRVGHLFVRYNPGRYDGVIVLEPVTDGFKDFGSLPPVDGYNARFYYAEVADGEGDGTAEIVATSNDCEPSCAMGSITSTPFRWDGTDYTEAAPGSASPLTQAPLRIDGIGPVRVGMTTAQAAAAAGTPIRLQSSVGSCGGAIPVGGPQGFSFMTDRSGITRVDVTVPSIRTGEGIGVGSTEADVSRAYGGHVTVQPHTYTNGHYLVVTSDKPELANYRFVFETNGTRVTTFRSGQEPNVEFVEGCA
jgi:hypothetical protein